LFAGLKKRLLGVKDSLREAGEITAKDKAGAFLKGEVVLDESKLDEVFSSFEISLLESDVALETAEKLIGDLKTALYGKRLKRGEVGSVALNSLRSSLRNALPPSPDIVELVERKAEKPYVVVFVGVNGTGKTTTIAKIACLLQERGLSCVLAASDTFRAGAIEQLEKHASKLGVKLIKHGRGADPAAVAYDAIEHARAHGKDAVLIDTAGRMETNVNLLDEMSKIARVAKPDLVLFVGDALTGNAAVEQAERFNRAVSLDGIILTKADADAKGGSAISIGSAIKKPIFYLGTGQEYGDLKKFGTEWFLDELLGG
jgi:fused signal recognition particle receptor